MFVAPPFESCRMAWELWEIMETLGEASVWILGMLVSIVILVVGGYFLDKVDDLITSIGHHFLSFVTFGIWPKKHDSTILGILEGVIGVVVLVFGLLVGFVLLGKMYDVLAAGWKFLFEGS